jgi:hypothetical protein
MGIIEGRPAVEEELPPEEFPEDFDALDYLRAVYKGQVPFDPSRVKAAAIAIAYERPKLSVQGSMNFRGMGDRIEQAHRKLIDVSPVAPQSAAVANAERERGDRG